MDERDTQQIINVQNLFIFVKKNFYLFMSIKIKITTNLRLPCTLKMVNLRFFSIKINVSLESFNSEKEI